MKNPNQNLKKRLTEIGAIAFVLFYSSCTTTNYTTARTQEINGGIIQAPVIADLNVKNTKVTGTSSASEKSADYVKKMAVADALRQSNADILVEPSYDIQAMGSQITVHVTGYPATYSNLRTAKPADTSLLQMSDRVRVLQTATNIGTSNGQDGLQNEAAQKKKVVTIASGILGAVLLIVIIAVASGV